MFKKIEKGDEMFSLASQLFPYNRSITGDGVRKTLADIKALLPSLSLHEVKTGTKVFDWVIPREWNCNDAYIITPDGEKICNFRDNNLHLLGYSIPVDLTMTLDELENRLYSREDLPEAVPYVTSYYNENWGFSMSHNQRKKLKKGNYRVFIDSSLKDGSLTYGEVKIKKNIPSNKNKEIFLSTYICHPSMANNELSGPVVTTFLLDWISKLKLRKFNYRAVFIPETIGSITYLSKNYKSMQKNVVAGFNISCVGDNDNYSFLPTRAGNTLADKVIKHVLTFKVKDFKEYTFLNRGSDERQYCSPGIDLPVASLMRTKYGEYSEYHTSLDNLQFISSEGLNGALEALALSIYCLENNMICKATNLCEPQLGKRGLRSNLSTVNHMNQFNRDVSNVLAYSDGFTDLLSISDLINRPLWEILPVMNELIDKELLIEVDE
jgi:aminopeptidase-like protein